MLKDYEELHEDHKQFKGGLINLSKLVSIMVNNHGTKIDGDAGLSKNLATIIAELNILSTTLVKIGDRYLNNEVIMESVTPNTDVNTTAYLETTYEYGDLASKLNVLIKDDITKFATNIGANDILPALDKLYNL